MNRWKFLIVCFTVNARIIAAWLIVTVALVAATGLKAQISFAGTQISVVGDTLGMVYGVAADGKGNLYVVDHSQGQLVMVPSTAGGFGAPVTLLSGLSNPEGIVADWSGNVYVADTGNNRIMMLPLAAGGKSAAVQVGSGFNSPASVAVDSAGNLYVADTGNNAVVELPHIGNGYGSAIQLVSGFNGPMGLAVDAAKNLYIADTGNNRIVKQFFTAGGYTTRQILGQGVVSPTAVSVDRNNNLFITYATTGRVIEDPWAAGANRYNSSIVVGSNIASPAGVVEDWSGNIFVADKGSKRVIEVVSQSIGFAALPLGGSSPYQTYNFSISAGTTVGSVAIYTQGVTGQDFVDGGGSSCVAQTYTSATLCGVNVAFSPLMSGQRMGAIVMYDAQGNPLATAFLAGKGSAPQAAFLPGTSIVLGSQLSGPAGVAVDGSGNIYIADTGNNRIVQIPWTGNGYGEQITVPVTGLSSPMGLAVDGAGNLYIVSNGNDKVVKLPWTGNGFGTQIKVGNGLYGPSDVAVDASGSIYIADTLDSLLGRMQWTGTSFGPEQPMGNYRRFLVSVAVNPDGDVFFAMPYQNSVAEIPKGPNQYLSQINLPLSGVSFPSGVATDANGNLYILDTGNNQVLMLPWRDGVFGNRIIVATGFNAPGGIAVDSRGNLYVADTGNNQIVKIDLSTPGMLSFASTYLGSTSTDSAKMTVIENVGNQPLVLSSVSFPPDFPESTASPNPCASGSSINPGNACSIAANFSPLTTGLPLTEAVNIVSNTLGVNDTGHSIAVAGNAFGKASQSISFPSVPDTSYGVGSIGLFATSSSGLPITYQVLSGPASLNYNKQSLKVTGIGIVVVQAVQAGNAQYTAAANVTISFSVTPATLLVTPLDVSATYGAVPANFNYSISGFVLGQSAGQVVAGRAAIFPSSSGLLGVGHYVLTASAGTLSAANYIFEFASGVLTVKAAVLQVRAGSTRCTYGSSIPTLTWSISGFVGGDSVNSITGTPTIYTTATLGARIGTYAIVPSLGTLMASNYTFSFISGTLTVAPAMLTVTADNKSTVYGQAIPTLTYSIAGFVAGDSSAAVVGAPVMTTSASIQSNAGTYTIIPSPGTLASPNYTFKYVAGVLSIRKAVLTITPSNAVMTYGKAVPAFSFTVSGFVNSDSKASAITGSPSLTAAVSSRSAPGTFLITATVGSLGSRSYTFTFGSGSLTINKAILTVTPRAVSMSYGSTLPTFAYDYTGFVNGDGMNYVKGEPLFSAAVTSGSPVGTYAIIGSFGSLSSSAYSFNVVNGTLTVTKAVLTIQPTSFALTYGSELPQLSYTLIGFVNGDDSKVVKGAPLLTTTASKTSSVGVYGITAKAGTLSATNYTFVTAGGAVTVNKAVLTVVPNAATMVYGGSVPKFTCSFTGLINGDGVGVITGTPTFQTVASSTSTVGQYAIEVNVGSLKANNYSFQTTSGMITVQKAVLTVTPASASMTYGGVVPQFTYAATGFVHGDDIRVLSGKPAYTTDASSSAAAGTYAVTASVGSLAAANYSFAFQQGKVTIGKAVLTVTSRPASMTYGSAVPAFSGLVQGFVNSDSVDVITGMPSFATNAGTNSPVGAYVVNVSAGTLSAANYTFSYVNGELDITPATLTVSADNLSMQAGSAVPKLTYSVHGFVNGDTATSSLTGTPSLTTTAQASSAVGTYPITATQGSMKSSNYNFTMTNGTLTVTK